MAFQDHQHQFCSKDCIIEAAVMSLNRLNLTINEMKRWTSERATLQDEIQRLRTALQANSNTTPNTPLSPDPLVKYQSDEIHRLTSNNNWMKKKLNSMSTALLETQRVITWNVNKKVRSEMAKINNKMAEERLHLAQEIARLKKQLENTNANATLQQIKRDLHEFAEGDKKLDRYLSDVTNKVIYTVNNLSNKLFNVNETLKKSESEKIYLQSESMQLKCLLTEKNNSESQLEYYNCLDEKEIKQINFQIEKNKLDENNINSIYFQEIKDEFVKLKNEKKLLLREKIMKEKALTRNVSGVKTKLAIALSENEKLNEKIKLLEHDIETKSRTVTNTLSVTAENEIERLQTLLEITKKQLNTTNLKLVCLEEKWNNNSDKNLLESQLALMKEQNNEISTLLMMEQTTAQEALKEFERSTKEIERLEGELENVKEERMILKKDIAKIKMENNELRDARMISRKKSITLVEEGVKERESLQLKIRLMKMRVNKLQGDVKISENKYNQYEETIKIIEDEKIRLQYQVDILIKGLDELTQDLKLMQLENSKITNTLEKLKLEKDEWIIEHENLNDKLKNYESQLDKLKIENVNINELLSKIKQLNEELKDTCQQNVFEIKNLTNRLTNAEDECNKLKIRIESMLLTISSLELCNTDMKTIINNSKNENDQLKIDRTNIDKEKLVLEQQLKKLQDELTIHSNKKNLKPPKTLFKEHLAKQSIEISKGMIDREFVTKTFNQFVSHSEKTLIKSLEETDKELECVKSELAKVRHEVEFLRTDLDNGKFGYRSLTTENCALKMELAKLKKEKQKLQKTQIISKQVK